MISTIIIIEKLGRFCIIEKIEEFCKKTLSRAPKTEMRPLPRNVKYIWIILASELVQGITKGNVCT